MPRATSKDTRTKQLRVLFFDHTAKMGGGEIALLNLIRSLDRELVYPIVVLGENGPLEDLLRSECEVHVFKLGERVARIRKDDLGWRSLAKFESIAVSGRYAWRLASFARQMEADLIHTNSLKADLIGGLAGKLAGIRIIWHVRDRIEPDYLPRAVVKLIRTLCRNVPDYVIANSEATLRTLHLEASNPGMAIASGVALESKRQVVHDGTPLSSEPVNELTGNSEMRVGLAGRIAPWKGQDVFIRAAAMLQSEFPNTRFEIIGAPLFAEREYEDRLHALCKELGVESRVVFHGFISGIGPLLEQMDLMVHASITGEPLGQVIIEAMAAGKAVVATNGGGVPEIVQDGFTGLLVPMGDAVAMADAIRGLLRDPQQRQRMGARGRERVVQNFTIETTARKVEAIYRALAGFA